MAQDSDFGPEPGRTGFDAVPAGDGPAPLPWLESADDIRPDGFTRNTWRFLGFVLIALAVLVALVGGLYLYTHRAAPAPVPDGSLITASREPWKNPAPGADPLRADASPAAASAGAPPAAPASAVVEAAPPAPAPSPTMVASAAPAPSPLPPSAASAPAAPPHPAASATPAKPASGQVGVQVGAYMTAAKAEEGWHKLAHANSVLSGVNHRVLEGESDIGHVYRLQALAPGLGAAQALCQTLTGAGIKCQVKP